MNQLIIVYIISGIAFLCAIVYAIRRFRKIRKNENPCEGCTGCDQ